MDVDPLERQVRHMRFYAISLHRMQVSSLMSVRFGSEGDVWLLLLPAGRYSWVRDLCIVSTSRFISRFDPI